MIADTEDNLQKSAYKLNRLITEYGLTVSVQKTKSMAFNTLRTGYENSRFWRFFFTTVKDR
jgi:hypothetical protein